MALIISYIQNLLRSINKKHNFSYDANQLYASCSIDVNEKVIFDLSNLVQWHKDKSP